MKAKKRESRWILQNWTLETLQGMKKNDQIQ